MLRPGGLPLANMDSLRVLLRRPWGAESAKPLRSGRPGVSGARHDAWEKEGAAAGMYAVMRFAKLKTMGQVGALGKHNERERETRNADEARRGDNVRLAGSGDWCADVQARLDTVPLVRTNAVLALEYVLTASRAFFADGDQARLAAWTERSMDWIRSVYGQQNVVAAVLHRDEITPHIQAVVVPIDARGRLTATAFTGAIAQVRELQTSYARAVEDLGLQRGVRGSEADHQTLKEFYAKIEQETPGLGRVLRAVDVDRPGRLVANPEKWAADQELRIAERLAPAVDAALVKARHFEEQAARAEANVGVLSARVRELETAYKEHIAQARAADLREVIGTLGGQPDKSDRHKWEMANGDHISVRGQKWFNHDRQTGGGGAIDLVKHVAGYDFTGAVAWLAHESGPLVAVAAAAQHGAQERTQQAQEIVDRGERAPSRLPEVADWRWPQVRAYLTGERALPADLVDPLHRAGTVYADARGNAVFLRQDAAGTPVGASLRGTLPGSDFKGLAPGSRRDEGYFSFTMGTRAAYQAPQVYMTESPIDALSLAALLSTQRGELTFLSTDGAGAVPRRQIDEALSRGALVHCAFDNDPGGAKLWAQVTEAYPGAKALVRERPPRGAKDWNDALRDQRQHADRPAPHDHDHGSRGTTRGRDDTSSRGR